MLTEEELKRFAAGWKRRKKEKDALLEERRILALQKARQTAAMLKEQYQAQKVMLFGSLAKGTFWEHADLDLAVSGISGACYLDAYWDAAQLALPFSLDLVILEEVPEKLRQKILDEGTVLA